MLMSIQEKVDPKFPSLFPGLSPISTRAERAMGKAAPACGTAPAPTMWSSPWPLALEIGMWIRDLGLEVT